MSFPDLEQELVARRARNSYQTVSYPFGAKSTPATLKFTHELIWI